jgi:hypothetical protein
MVGRWGGGAMRIDSVDAVGDGELRQRSARRIFSDPISMREPACRYRTGAKKRAYTYRRGASSATWL